MFFVRSDSDDVVLGINEAQLISLTLVAVAGAVLARRKKRSGAPA